MEIKEYKRDDSKDYLFILKSLNEIPFPVGKKLLSDFLSGDLDNPSIEKNKLFDLINFGSLDHLDKGKINELIDSMIGNKFIDESPSMFNKFIKVLSISILGKKELISPTLNKKQIAGKVEDIETKISEREMQAFKELNDFLGNLNMEQKKAVVSSSKKILCIAGAGSGKTTVLTKRIEFLNKMKKIKGDEILAITFTKKARKEMQDRLEKLKVKAVVETFNSFCEKILLKNTARIYGKKFRVATYQDKMIAILRALENKGISFENAIEKYFSKNQIKNKSSYQLQGMFVNDCFSVLEYYKMTKKTLDDFSVGLMGKDFENAKMIYEIVKYLDNHMVTNGLRTYADQINDALNFFKSYPKQIPKFQHILVDEYQDVNSQQVELLNLLDSENIFFVGDPRQSIFGWRGSNVNFILDLLNDDNVDVISLNKNYRSSEHIVELMNKSIEQMRMPNLISDKKEDKNIKLCSFASEDVEYDFIGRKILLSDSKRNDIYILARTNRQLEEIGESLKKKGIRFILKGDDIKDITPKEDEIVLSTIHSIKGLEAKEVYVIGCTQNNFPCKVSEHPIMEIVKMYEFDKEEEERRLFYVAISRAKSRLYLTYHGKKHTYFITEDMKKIVDVVDF